MGNLLLFANEEFHCFDEVDCEEIETVQNAPLPPPQNIPSDDERYLASEKTFLMRMRAARGPEDASSFSQRMDLKINPIKPSSAAKHESSLGQLIRSLSSTDLECIRRLSSRKAQKSKAKIESSLRERYRQKYSFSNEPPISVW